MSVFISHSSKDKYLIDFFVDKILILGCGLKDDQIFCTSIDGLGIKTGEDFRKHIKSNLIHSDYSFIMISSNYHQSEVCLNEMGASWALDNIRIKQFLFPNLGFDSLGFLINTLQGAKIDSSSDLDELYEELKLKYKTDITVTRWNKHKMEFLKAVSDYLIEQQDNITPSPENYFNTYIIENLSINHVLLKAHPTLLDCKMIFSEKYYRIFFENYCQQYEKIEKEYMEPMYPQKQFVRIIKTNTTELRNGIDKIAGGMVDAAKKGFFNNSVDFYRVTFLEKEDSEFGISYKVFCFVNDRWIFIPHPWEIIDC